MPQNISDLTEQYEFGFAPLYIINANVLPYTIDNYMSEYIFLKKNILTTIILQHSPLLRGYALTFPTCTLPIFRMVCYCTKVLQIPNFTGSFNMTMCVLWVHMISVLAVLLGRTEFQVSLMCIPYFPGKQTKIPQNKEKHFKMQEMIWNIVWIECSILDFSPTASINPSHGRTDMCCYIYIYLYIYNYVHFCLSIYMYYCRLIERYLEIYIYLYLGKRKVFVCVFVCLVAALYFALPCWFQKKQNQSLPYVD